MGHDLVIRSGTIVDGTGADSFTGDLAIDEGVITQVGGDVGQGSRGKGSRGRRGRGEGPRDDQQRPAADFPIRFRLYQQKHMRTF